MNRIAVIFCFLTGVFLIYTGYLFFSTTDKVYPNNKISEGKKVWLKYNCNACHQIYGLGGFLGPDLTNIISRTDSNYLKAFVLSGTKVMPKFKMEENELTSLINFFVSIDSSGSSDPRYLNKLKYGAIE